MSRPDGPLLASGQTARVPWRSLSGMAPSAVVFDNRLYVFYGSGECPWSEENMWYRFVDQHGNWWPDDSDEELVGSTTAVAPAVAVFRGRL